MKVSGICCGRKNGNTEILMKAARAQAEIQRQRSCYAGWTDGAKLP